MVVWEFFEGNALSEPQRAELVRRCEQLAQMSRSELHQLQTEQVGELHSDFGPGVIDGTEDCPICFDVMEAQQPVLRCPTCKKHVHETCMRKWLSCTCQKNCMCCRSRTWEQFSI